MNEGLGLYSAMVWIISITGWWKCSRGRSRNSRRISLLLPTSSAVRRAMNLIDVPRCCRVGRASGSVRRLVAVRVALRSLRCTQSARAQTQNPPAKNPTSHNESGYYGCKRLLRRKNTAAPVPPHRKVDQQLSDLALALRDKPTAAAEKHLPILRKLHAKDEYGLWAESRAGSLQFGSQSSSRRAEMFHCRRAAPLAAGRICNVLARANAAAVRPK